MPAQQALYEKLGRNNFQQLHSQAGLHSKKLDLTNSFSSRASGWIEFNSVAVFSNLYFHQSFQNQSLRLAVTSYLLQEQPWNSYPFVFKVPVNSILRVFRFLLRFVPN